MVAAAPLAERPQETTVNKMIAALVLVAAVAAFLAHATPGHRVLNSLGFATADGGGSCGTC